MVDVKDENKHDFTQDQNGANGGGDFGGGSGGSRQQQQQNSSNPEPEQFRKLFIGGLSLNTTDETLHNFYSQFGTLVDCIVMRDSQTKRSRGFGFVSFQTQAQVDNAMQARPHTIDGKVVDPKRAVPRDQSQKTEQNMSTKRLYVSGVRDEHTEDMFEKHFGQFGAVTKVEIITDKNTGKSRGFGFITFDDYDPVDRCVLLKSHMIHGFRCDVKKALSRDEMQKAQQKERDRMERGTRSRGNQRDGGGYGRGGGGGGYGGGYGHQYGGGGYGHGPPPPAWGPPPTGPPSWGYGSYTYGQQAPAQPWGTPAGAAPPPPGPGPQATEQGQWAASGAVGGGGYAAGWGPTPQAQWPAGGAAAPVGAGTSQPPGASGGQPSADYGNWPAATGPQGVPPPAQNWGASRY